MYCGNGDAHRLGARELWEGCRHRATAAPCTSPKLPVVGWERWGMMDLAGLTQRLHQGAVCAQAEPPILSLLADVFHTGTLGSFSQATSGISRRHVGETHFSSCFLNCEHQLKGSD